VADWQTDILIVGGGLTGATLIHALKTSGYRCLLLEANSFADNLALDLNSRSIALAPASINILDQLGLWDSVKPLATPIWAIHVSQQKHFGRATIQGDEPLGYLVEMPHLSHLLQQWLPEKNVLTQTQFQSYDAEKQKVICLHKGKQKIIETKFIVAADGMQSAVRKAGQFQQTQRDYGQSAVITNIQLNRDHQCQAFERFTQEGPLAMLPLSAQRCAMVWAMAPLKAVKLAALNEKEFLSQLQQAFGYRLGRLQAAGKRVVIPLQQVITENPVKWPIALVGNAAQTLHPVAGQGFNLALRDVATLAQLVCQQGLSIGMLDIYRQKRESDRTAIVRFTNGLIDLFRYSIPGVNLARGLGLLAFDNSQLLKQQLSHYARGFAGFTPDLACGIPIKQGVSHV
jgi:2-octaprenyl-6-methoxyphenol hydroxylase